MNRRSFLRTLAGLAAATWAETFVEPVIVEKFRQPGVSFPEGSISYQELEAAYQACQEGCDEPNLVLLKGKWYTNESQGFL